LLLAVFVVPLIGNIWPQHVSFLLAMRYYAGNWPGSVWMIKKSAWKKLSKLKAFGRTVPDQLGMIYTPQDMVNFGSRVIAFRSLHAHGRLLPKLIRLGINASAGTGKESKNGKNRLVNDEGDEIRTTECPAWSEYQYIEGEFVASFALGYNFGDGYWHGKYMASALQDVCQFEKGEALHISWDSFRLFGSHLPWSVRDVSTIWGKPIAEGKTSIDEIWELQPY